MKKYIYILIILVCPNLFIGQPSNLVPNHSFESATCDPFGVNFSPQAWKQLQGSPDYFHSSFSPPCPVIGNLSNYQLANDGLGFIGIDVYCPVNICPNNYDKESVQCKLNDTLRFGKSIAYPSM
ncbi:MAG: hypothetical protein IPG89_07390 [Bacteroidetes bacterium]|nr:hypothetical protein [Bacteroidota bacterium]